MSVKGHTDGKPEQSDYNAELQAVKQYLMKNGFKRGRKTVCVQINPAHIVHRNLYFRTLLENRNLLISKRLGEVYTDESYNRHHHRLDHISFYHPESEEEGGNHLEKAVEYVS